MKTKEKIPQRWLLYMLIGMPLMTITTMFPPVFPYTLFGLFIIIYCFFCLFMMMREF